MTHKKAQRSTTGKNEDFCEATLNCHADKDKMGRRLGYARVSTDEQSLSLQLDALKAAQCDFIFEEKISGKSKVLPALEQALQALQPHDKIIVWRLDRLGRSFRHLVDVADRIKERNAHIVSVSDGIDTSTTMGEVIYRIMSVFADLEHKSIVERTVAGLAATRARGQRLGRPPKLSAPQIAEAKSMLAKGQPVKAVAFRFGVDQSTIFRVKRESRPSRPANS